MDSKVLNIRNVPEKLVKRAKMQALEEGRTLREIVIEALETFLKPINGGEVMQPGVTHEDRKPLWKGKEGRLV